MSGTETDFGHVTRHIQSLGRRDFLKISSIAAGLLAAGITPGRANAMPDGIVHMSEEDYAVFHRLMVVMFPTEGSTLVPAQDLPVMQTLDGALLATMPPHVLNGLKGGLAYFNGAPQDTMGKPFVDLSDDEAAAFCDALAQSDAVPARGLIGALKFLVGVAYWAIPPSWGPLGFDGPVFEAWGLEHAGNAPLPTA